MEYREFTGKTVEDAVMEAAIELETTSDKLDYEILEKGSSGFLGIGSKPAKIKARKLMETVDRVEEFLADVFAAMQIDAKIEITENKEENTISDADRYMKKIILSIDGMTCSACSNRLEKYLLKQDGIINASVNLVMSNAFVEYDETKLNIKMLKNL